MLLSRAFEIHCFLLMRHMHGYLSMNMYVLQTDNLACELIKSRCREGIASSPAYLLWEDCIVYDILLIWFVNTWQAVIKVGSRPVEREKVPCLASALTSLPFTWLPLLGWRHSFISYRSRYHSDTLHCPWLSLHTYSITHSYFRNGSRIKWDGHGHGRRLIMQGWAEQSLQQRWLEYTLLMYLPHHIVSMLWNWYTIDSCFLSSSWHVKSHSQFAGSVIGICLLVMAIEGVRRLGREYDRRLLRSRNDAIENLSCGMGMPGAGLAINAAKMVPAIGAEPIPEVTMASPTTTTGGCGSKSGGCGSKNKAASISEPEITPVAAATGGGCCGGKTSSPATSTPNKEYKKYNDTPTAELGGFSQLNTLGSGAGGFTQMHCRPPIPRLPTWTQQLVRSFIYGSQFSAAFLVWASTTYSSAFAPVPYVEILILTLCFCYFFSMLLGMYFNGFVLIAIFIGATLGYLVFGSDTVSAPEASAKNESPCCC